MSKGSLDRFKSGFTLPTVMIVSIIMFGVLALAMRFVSQSSSSLRDIYYNQLAREAVESGTIHAQECLRLNGYAASWTAAKPLMPNTDCSGNVVSESPNVLNSTTVRSSYKVAPPVAGDGSQIVVVSGSVDQVQSGGSVVYRSYTYTGRVNTGARISFDTVTFGYILSGESNSLGAFFGVIDTKNRLLTAGYNNMGQLGNGTTIDSPVPVEYLLPSGVGAKKVFTSFLSIGGNVFVIGLDGKTYGTGRNEVNQLGDGGPASSHSSIPREVKLPSGVTVRSVGVGRYANYFIGSDYRIYASGSCAMGRLGDGKSASGCANASTPVRVNVFDSTSDSVKPVLESDWLQSTNIAVDYNTAYVRTVAGRVYGWGSNHDGQLSTGDYATQISPVQIGTLGNTGQPKAIQVAFNGSTLYVLADSGKLYSVGAASYGQLLGAVTRLKYKADPTKCLTFKGQSVALTLEACGSTVTANQLFKFRADGRVESSGFCIERLSGGTATGTNLVGGSCSTFFERQDWEMNVSGDNKLYNKPSNRCLDAAVATAIKLAVCDAARNATQEWILEDSTAIREVPLPSGTKAVRVTTDQKSAHVLLDNGEVWGAGANHSGQLGIGITRSFSAVLKKMVLPAGRKAVDVYTTMAGSHDSENTQSNTFAVLDNGDVVGAGSNQFGTLGIGTFGGYYITPQKMNLPTGVKAKSVQSGLGTTVVLSTAGQIYTVGNNSNGQLGDGTTINSATPAARPYVNVLPSIIF